MICKEDKEQQKEDNQNDLEVKVIKKETANNLKELNDNGRTTITEELCIFNNNLYKVAKEKQIVATMEQLIINIGTKAKELIWHNRCDQVTEIEIKRGLSRMDKRKSKSSTIMDIEQKKKVLMEKSERNNIIIQLTNRWIGSIIESEPIKYHPHYISNNKQHAGRMIVNKYAKGKAKYEHHESNKSDNIDDEYMENIDENIKEYDDSYNSLHDIKNKR
ncbi:hypothetical protein C1645_832057 [Glomus cerebriforme]|uniref:Uncharacterized protein n=1 Tax=Glomus cerebriforme TaxID=658196 RepID=A0A397SPK8_9GLOM|nr:hypothetical protein C1645_832057 [Glomus cerebriforme]